MTGQTSFEMNPEHAVASTYLLWNALTVALREVASRYPDDRWKQPLLAECMQYIDNLTEVEASGDPALLSGLRAMRSPEAMESARTALRSAFDRVVHE